MNRSKEMPKKLLEYILPGLVLGILLAYSYAKFFEHPYGIWWLPDGTVALVFVNEREPTIHAGDQLVSVGSLEYAAYAADLRKTLFAGIKPGTTVPVTVERGGQRLTVSWRLPGPNAGEMQDQLFSQWFLAYFFWLAGTATLLLLRPRDIRWLLLAVFDFVTAIWLIAGSGLSNFHIWYSALVLRSAIWISLPIYLHLHWVFPRPLGKLPGWLVIASYAICGVLAIAQWFQLLPSGLYAVPFLTAILGSLVLLLIHALRQPDMRRELGFLLIAAVLAIVPSITLGVATALTGSAPPVSTLGLLSFPILPFAYLFAARRRQLGGLEIRVNRLLTIYAFLILLGSVMMPILIGIDRLPVYAPDQGLIADLLISILVVALSLAGFPVFQRFVEQRVLGITVASAKLQQAYSAHITSSTSFAALTRILDDQILPSLLVRQFAFLLLDNGTPRILLSCGVNDEQIPAQEAASVLPPLIEENPASGMLNEPRYGWIRLVLPLRVQDTLLGFWLFGRRDPDDMYSNVEVPILQLFANQAAIALSNILQGEQLRAMYQADINRHENERLDLARELHDSVLSELGGMLMNADIDSLPRNFQEGYQSLTERLREIVRDLRPPMLNYGLKPAIEELADSLMERSKTPLEVIVELESSDERFPIEKEQHLFRIVQEACENAARHAHGTKIRISGQIMAGEVGLVVEDNGDGFRPGKQEIGLYELLSERHFGMAGMFERAALIKATIRVQSSPGKGTRLQLRWRPGEQDGSQGPGDLSS